MTLRKLLSQLTVLLFALSAVLLLGNAYFQYSKIDQHYQAITDQFFDSTFEIYRTDIIGNVLVGSNEIVQALVDKVAAKRKVAIQLKTATATYASGTPVGVSKDYLLQNADKKIGILKIFLASDPKDRPWISDLIIAVVIESVLLFLGFVLLLRLLNTRLLSPIALIVSHLKSASLDKLQTDTTSILEVQELSSALRDMSQQVALRAKSEAIAKIAAQVAHDVRSPLTALSMLESDLGRLPEETRLIVRSAVGRIRDIANLLLEKNREFHRPPESVGAEKKSEEPGSHLLSSLLEGIITEKRMQYRPKIGIEINARLDASSYGLFAMIVPTEFKRIISNLITNCVEALDDHGIIEVFLEAKAERSVQIRVSDNGKGISPEVLGKLGQRGQTHGKEGGSGLGLYHARTSVESWGGALTLHSEVGKGTTVTVELPRTPAPKWFVPSLEIVPASTVVVLDDDTSVHQIWQGRFDVLVAKNPDVQLQLVHFSTPKEIEDWVIGNGQNLSSILYLFDFELIGENTNGLALIEKLGIQKNAILVTSRYEEKVIRDNCKRLGVRLIPKDMAGFVPIGLAKQKDLCDAILIDDDELVRMSWSMAAKASSKRLRVFSQPVDFFAESETLSKNSPVYVDANLGHGVKGEEVAEQIHHLGFTRVFLATGYEPENYRQYQFLQGVLGKDPPFLKSVNS